MKRVFYETRYLLDFHLLFESFFCSFYIYSINATLESFKSVLTRSIYIQNTPLTGYTV